MRNIIWTLLLLALTSTGWSVTPVNPDGPVKVRDTTPLILPRNPSNRQPPAEVSARIEKLFNAFQKNDVEAGFQGLFGDSEEIGRKYDVNDFIAKTKQAISLYGEAKGFELYDNRMVGSHIMYLTYFVYLKSIPLRWRFIFYNNDGTRWQLINLSVDDLLDQSLLAE